MKTIKKLGLLLVALTGFASYAQQFDVNADLRARLENRNGYGTLKPVGEEAATFVTQRARIQFDFTTEKFKLRFSPQNIRVWGDVTTMATDDKSSSFHEAFADLKLNDKWSFKAGRQEISYDDERIFGAVDWAMQGRSHDAGVFKYVPNSKNRLDVGIAFNAMKESNFNEDYTLNQYKALQYAWYHGDFKKLGVSFLFLNNGTAYTESTDEKIAYGQTIGPRFTYKTDKLNLDGALYLQTGEASVSNAVKDVMASYFSANANYNATKNLTAGLGFEWLSGKDQNDTSSDIKSFTPLYGTNHKFNGYMDYFYVGNHINSVGLSDVYLNFVYKKDKLTARLMPHYFASAADIYSNGKKQDNYLGTEIDFTLSYKLYENVTIDGGFSQMFASDSMEVLKNNGSDKGNGNNWAFLSLKINPKLFSSKLGESK